jgi:LEA14-like dessication related protein
MARPSPRLLALAAAPLLLAGCAALGKLAEGAVQKPTLTFKAAAVESLDFDGATLALDFTLSNPNRFGLRLARVQSWLQLDGRVVTRAELPGGLTIPAAGEAPVRFTARLPFAEVPHLLELVTRGGGEVPYTVGGLVAVETPLGPMELPASHSGRVALPALPTFDFAGASVRLASLTEVELTVNVAVRNPNPFPLPPGALRYQLAVGGEVVASADAAALAAVAARGQGRVVVPVRLSLLGAGRALGALVRGGTADVRVSGEARLGALPVPLDVAGTARGR